MADSKISGLPIAEQLTGSELVPIVQDGETRQASSNQLNTFLQANLITAEAGEDITLTSSADSFYKFTWTGGNGIFGVSLPLASQSQNRLYRFISDNTITANKYIKILPTSPNTLDGSTTAFLINRAYEGVQVWCDGVEWFIIQQKA